MHKTFKNTKINADIYLQLQDYSRGPKLLKKCNFMEPLPKLMESTFQIFFPSKCMDWSHPAGALEECKKNAINF